MNSALRYVGGVLTTLPCITELPFDKYTPLICRLRLRLSRFDSDVTVIIITNLARHPALYCTVLYYPQLFTVTM